MSIPQCPYFQECGGCQTQHLDYALQLENKKTRIEQALKINNIKTFPSKPYNYRNRMDFIFTKTGLGQRKQGRWDKVVPIEECPIANQTINKLLKEINKAFPAPDFFNLREKTGTMRFAVVRTTSTQSAISFVLNKDSPRKEEAIKNIKTYAQTSSADNILITQIPAEIDMSIGSEYEIIKGSDILVETIKQKEISFNVQGFFQNNTAAAREMHDYVHQLLKSYNATNANLLDLYGGVGAFGIVNANLFKNITIVEEFAPAIEQAKQNAKKNELRNIDAFACDAKKLSTVKLSSPLYVVTDPPRSGMHQKASATLKQLAPEVIIYVSCNPKILKKEIARYKNYEIKSVALFDFFPQTNHAETVIELIKKQS